MPFWTPKTNINLNSQSKKTSIDGNFGEFLEQKNKTIFLRSVLSRKKIIYISGLFLIFFLILTFRIAYLQILKGDYYSNLAENNRIRTQIIPAYRGIIYDRNNIPLVKNKPIFTLSLIPNQLPAIPAEKNELLQTVAETIDKPQKDVEAILIDYQSYSNETVLIHNNLPHEAVLTLTQLSSEQPAIIVTEQIQREYICADVNSDLKSEDIECPQSLSHILGYIGPISKPEYEKRKNDGYYLQDYVGKTGVEIFYEKTLRGEFGKKQIEIDALGNEKRIIAKEEAQSGKDLILTIDVEAQAQLEKIVREYLKKYNKKRASAIIMNPKNGDVLAMVSLPAFSNNDFSGGISNELYDKLIKDPDQPLFFRAVSGEYPSGSVIKPIWAAAALEEGIIAANTTFLSTGGIQIGSWFFPDWKAGGHGPTNVVKAIAESVNTFFYYIGGGFDAFQGLGLDKLLKYAILFGLGEKTQIDLPFEKEGFFPDENWKTETYNQQWYIGDTYHLSIGQGFLLVTPLQMAVLTSTIANGGELIVPHILKEIVASPGLAHVQEPDVPQPKKKSKKIIKKKKRLKIKRKNFIKTENLEIVKRGMRDAVLYGSAQKLIDVGIDVAGKTGTAQASSKHPPHSWFTGFLPYENPELAITVLVEEGGEGSGMATQITRDFVRWYISN